MSGWSTGLLALWDDFETMLNGTALCGALLVLMPAKNNTDLNDGKPSCGIKSEFIGKAFRNCGCTDRDAAFTVNLALFAAFPWIAILWRKQIRDFYSIDGSLPGDFLACCFCFPCMTMQESRELKKRGINMMEVPHQVNMGSR